MRIYFLTLGNHILPFNFLETIRFENTQKAIEWMKALKDRNVLLTDIALSPYQIRNIKSNIIPIAQGHSSSRYILNEILRLTRPDLEE